MDGLHPTELQDRLDNDPTALPHLRWLRERAAVVASGSMVNFPSITWPSHTCIGTGSWCGHHDVVNPSYYLREKRETVSPQGQQLNTEGFSSPEVESIYEAFKRVRGPGCITAAIFAPFGRGADHANLEGRNLCDKQRLRALNATFSADEDPRWRETGSADAIQESVLDSRGVTQVHVLFEGWRVCRRHGGDPLKRDHQRLERIAVRVHPGGHPQRFDVLDVVLQVAGLGIAVTTASRAAMIDVDELRGVPQFNRCVRLEEGVVATGAAVQQNHRRPSLHQRAFGGQADAIDIDEERDAIVHFDSH